MKTSDKQIVALLSAFDKKDVLKAFELYQNGSDLEKELHEDGWFPYAAKPENKEFYLINGLYWVQSEEHTERDRQKQRETFKKENRAKRAKKKQSMSLKQVPVKCGICGSCMYKQNVCPGCKDGKAGYKIRLICEENHDHEVLL